MIPTLTLKSGNKIPRLGLGTWKIGGMMDRDPQNDDRGQIESIRYALDQGIRFIRTAQNYADGHCEELVGEAISSYDRSKLCLMTSIFENYAKDEESIISELSKSLKRLKTDYVDVLIIGGINPSISLKKVSAGLLAAKKLGIAKDVGVGNYRLNELTYLNQVMEGNLSYNEMQYNLIIREPKLNQVIDYQIDNQIIFGAYRPLQLGQLSKEGIVVLDQVAHKYNKTQSQVALKWLLMQENLVTFPKTTNISHIDQLVDLFSWDLSQEDFENLDLNFPIQMRMGDCIPPVNSFTR